MTPLDYIAASDWTPLLSVLLAAVLVAWTWRQIHRYHQTRLDSYREDHRIPAAERDLLGEDWTAPVAPYFRERFIRRTRTRMAIYSATGADPYKSESQTAATAGSRSIKGVTQ